ncbi:hypothetical protein K469DRAFT_573314 [Zopfia rhizophila CBS 207.26]|uniref:F-box domain-containing protein n=1 Tax=Zopfia rhizophila CBS 207.26 TaxID=1314779 RepID=A0A6A6E8R3_9PEZI|nr:hypothetical protein K469DRAFT_573314 [Zopfia rhizophila CBS 207.26]
MDRAGSTIPAWKRLGLKLKTDQSGDPVPDQSVPWDLERQLTESPAAWRGSRDDTYQAAIPTENGKSSRLGKRKLRESPAEGRDQAFKTSRKTKGQEHVNGITGNELSNLSKEGNGNESSGPEAASVADRPRAKGDPNYRKKKDQRINLSPGQPATLEQHQAHAESMTANHELHTTRSSRSETNHKQSRRQSPSPTSEEQPSLQVSIENNFTSLPSVETPEASKRLKTPASKTIKNAPVDSSSPTPDRRKSVTFTPDTKTTDGSSASALFKKWITEQKGSGAEFTPAEVAQFVPPPKVHPANDIPAMQSSMQTQEGKKAKDADIKERKGKKKQKEVCLDTASLPKDAKSRDSKKITGKKDTSIYLSYLSEFHNSKDSWKFNKAKQTDVLENALNVFRIPQEYSEALIAYIKGLQGAGVIDRLRERWTAALKELDEGASEPMDDPEARKAAKDAALQDRLAKEKKRRRAEVDIEGLAQSADPNAYIRQMKRRRAEELLNALALSSPLYPTPPQVNGGCHRTVFQDTVPTTIRPKARNRKLRTAASDDASSSSSSDSSSGDESGSSDSDASGTDEDESESHSEDEEGPDSSDSTQSEEDDSSEEGSSESRSDSAFIYPPPIQDILCENTDQSHSISGTEMPLTTLPAELIEFIARSLSAIDFRSFRLVSALLKEQSLHHFKERFFRRRTIEWTVPSLQALLDISCHSDFGSCLQELVIDATPRFAIQLWEIKKNILDNSHDSGLRKLYEIKHALLNGKEEESSRYFAETRFDQKTLIAVFERIKTLHSIAFSYDGMDRSYGKFGRKYCESSQNEMSRPFVSTIAAIARSGLIIQRISVEDGKRYGAISVGRLESISPVLPIISTSFSRLQTLKLDLRDWRHPEEGFEPPPGKAPFVVRLLSKAMNVKDLDVSCFSSLEPDIFAEMAEHCVFPHLISLRLKLFRITNSSLDRFLEPSKRTLKNISLSRIVLRDGAWPDVMRLFARELQLESLELEDLFCRMGSKVGFENSMKKAVALERPDLDQKIRFHADNLAFGNWEPVWHVASVTYPFIGLRT